MNHMPQALVIKDAKPLPLKGRALAKLRTRERVLAAARQQFGELGFEQATIRGIAAAAGMSTGAVFASFSDKAELFDEILIADFEAVYGGMQAALDVPGTITDRLVGLFTFAYAACFSQLPLVRTSIAVSWTRSEAAEKRNRDALKPIFNMITEALRDASRRGELSQEAPAPLITSMLWEVYLAGYRATIYDRKSIDDLIERLRAKMGLILAGVRP